MVTYINQFKPIQTSSNFFTSSTKSLLDWLKSKSDLFQSQQSLDTSCTTDVMFWLLSCDPSSMVETCPDQVTRSWIHTQVTDKSSTKILLRSVKASTGNAFVSQSHNIDCSWTHSGDLQRSLKHCVQIALQSSWNSWILTLPFLGESPFLWDL